MCAAVANPVVQQQPSPAAANTAVVVVERKRRRSRAAVTLLATANAILRVLGVNNNKSTASAVLKLHQINGHQAPTAAVMPAAPPSPPQSVEGSPPRSNGVLIGDGRHQLHLQNHLHQNHNHHQTMTRHMEQNVSPQQQQQQQQQQPAKRSPRDFIFGKSIGEGSFSNVYLAKDIHSRKEYAIKVCDKRHILRERKAEYIKREKEVLNMLSTCEFGFVHLYCTFQDADNLYFVLSYAKNGELLPYINKVGSFDLACTRFYAAEILVALEKLHCRGIIHRDLKPENILLDENMHILITDFGSAKILNEDASNLNSTDGEICERRNSFVGTAQYVSPELLKDKRASKVSDLWAFGCIIYQMVSGLPPFRDGSEYLIFQKILKLNYEFPEGFDETAKDLVEKLLVLDPCKRLGINDDGPTYESVRSHPFFDGIEWDTLYKQTPPDIYPYLPGRSAAEELRSQYRVPDHLEPGLDDKQLTRLFGLELGIAEPRQPKGICDLSSEEIERRLEKQKLDKWHPFVENNLILKQGFVNKRKGLFARKRMLLLTMGPRLFYVDPYNMVLKGEIPWSPELRVEPKNFKIFFVHTPNRTYYLEDPEGYALQWCKDIEDVRLHVYGKQQPK